MILLHIADLHLGKTLGNFSFLEDQAEILNQILQIADEEHADAVLIAGDVYQKSAPPAEAMALFDSFITRLAQKSIKVFIISGNHDSAARVSYFSALARASGVFISEEFHGRLQFFTLEDAYGPIKFYLLPFLRPSDVRSFFPQSKIADCAEAVRAVLSASPVDECERSVLLAHQFIIGAQISDSEEHMVGGLEEIPAALFDVFDYVALGHLHRAQRISRESMRYAGSPLKYSLSEVAHKKSVCIVTMKQKGNIAIKERPLIPVRDMRAVAGTLEEVLSMPPSNDYAFVTITDEIVPPDAVYSVTSVFPNMLRFSVENSKTGAQGRVVSQELPEEKDIFALFTEFYRRQNNGQPPSDRHLDVLRQVITELEAKEK